MLAVVVASLLVAFALAWAFTPLAHAIDLHRLMALGHSLRESPVTPFAIAALYVIAGLCALPLTLVIGATVLSLGAWPGGPYAWGGSLLSAALIFWIGRIAGRDVVDQWALRSPRLQHLDRLLARRGLIAIALVRLIPAPYSLINAFAGASQIRFVDFMLGTALGLLPVIALLAGVAAPLEAWLDHPDWKHAVLLTCVVLFVIAMLWVLRRVVTRRLDQSSG